jgi:hypothetical protein
MHWTYDELLALPYEIYEELVLWATEANGQDDE